MATLGQFLEIQHLSDGAAPHGQEVLVKVIFCLDVSHFTTDGILGYTPLFDGHASNDGESPATAAK